MSSADTSSSKAPVLGAMDGTRAALICLGGALVLTLAQYSGLLPEVLHRLPDALVPPFADWLDAVFNFVKDDLGLLALTRFLTEGLEWVLDVTGNLLFGRRRWPYLGPIPWAAIASVVAVLGYWLGGWRLALLAGGTFLWTALVGQWEIAMQTVSVLIVAAPVAFVLGLSLGITAWKYPAFERAIKPALAVLQTLPFFTYLLPAVIFFKVGPTAGAVATVIFATPPMVLMTILGLQKVSPEVVESGKMSGCTRLQMLRHVYIPSARTELLVGVNQVIMLCLAMVVLTAFIGMPGLGAKLLEMMGSFRLGRSFEVGVTIVLLAVTLDRLSKAWVAKQPVHFERNTPWWQQHRLALLALFAFTVFYILATFFPILAEIGRRQSLSMGREIDGVMRDFLALDWVRSTTGAMRVFFNTMVLIPFRNALLSLPTPAVILLIAALGLWLGGRKQALIAASFFALVALTGWWDRAIITLYSVLSAVIMAAVIGLPLAVLAARNETAARRVLIACDTAQTFPSFVYLLPAIMLFGITDIAVVFSILIFATVPLVRYTIEGLRTVPLEITEAADMSGATRWQRLLNVELPLAFPTMVVGVNQAIMFAFFMVIIAAFIGTQDLGQELQRTLAGTNLGTNFVLGICVSLMALSFDTIIMKWAADRKRQLGLGS